MIFLLHMEEKEEKQFSWDKLATVKRDINDTHTPCIYVYIVRQSSQMVWVENNWHKGVKRHGEAQVQAYQPLATCRGEDRLGKKESQQTGQELRPRGTADSVQTGRVQGASDYSEVPASSMLTSRTPATREGERSGWEQPKLRENLSKSL